MLRTHEELRRAGFLHPFQRHATWTDSQVLLPSLSIRAKGPSVFGLSLLPSVRTHSSCTCRREERPVYQQFVSSLSFRTSQKRSRPSEDTDAHSVPVLLWSHTTS